MCSVRLCCAVFSVQCAVCRLRLCYLVCSVQCVLCRPFSELVHHPWCKSVWVSTPICTLHTLHTAMHTHLRTLHTSVPITADPFVHCMHYTLIHTCGKDNSPDILGSQWSNLLYSVPYFLAFLIYLDLWTCAVRTFVSMKLEQAKLREVIR